VEGGEGVKKRGFECSTIARISQMISPKTRLRREEEEDEEGLLCMQLTF
ncbi:hypothetical protein CSUI_007838, partial [Cystoisospora suis]